MLEPYVSLLIILSRPCSGLRTELECFLRLPPCSRGLSGGWCLIMMPLPCWSQGQAAQYRSATVNREKSIHRPNLCLLVLVLRDDQIDVLRGYEMDKLGVLLGYLLGVLGHIC